MTADAAVRAALKSQYHAALAMLREAVERCPDDLWTEGAPAPYWQHAYHALFYTHFYLSPDEAAFRPWPAHRADVQHLPETPGAEAGTPYTRAQLLEYCGIVRDRLDADVDALDLASASSGFPWYPIPKLEHQLVNLRHVQHHAAVLAARLRTHADHGIDWVGARRRG